MDIGSSKIKKINQRIASQMNNPKKESNQKLGMNQVILKKANRLNNSRKPKIRLA
jgi:hypothetical protein